MEVIIYLNTSRFLVCGLGAQSNICTRFDDVLFARAGSNCNRSAGL